MKCAVPYCIAAMLVLFTGVFAAHAEDNAGCQATCRHVLDSCNEGQQPGCDATFNECLNGCPQDGDAPVPGDSPGSESVQDPTPTPAPETPAPETPTPETPAPENG